jgi:putative addiction module antidote
MGNKVILRQMGGSIGVTIPKELAEKYHLEKGNEIFIFDTEEGILLSPYDPHFDQALKLYDKGARKYHAVLKRLAE